MFATHSHPYLLQVAALWCSFMPPLAILLLIAGAQLERLRHGLRRPYDRTREVQPILRLARAHRPRSAARSVRPS